MGSKVSSYQKLRTKKLELESEREELLEDLQFIVLYPHSKRAKVTRMQIRDKYDNC